MSSIKQERLLYRSNPKTLKFKCLEYELEPIPALKDACFTHHHCHIPCADTSSTILAINSATAVGTEANIELTMSASHATAVVESTFQLVIASIDGRRTVFGKVCCSQKKINQATSFSPGFEGPPAVAIVSCPWPAGVRQVDLRHYTLG